MHFHLLCQLYMKTIGHYVDLVLNTLVDTGQCTFMETKWLINSWCKFIVRFHYCPNLFVGVFTVKYYNLMT